MWTKSEKHSISLIDNMKSSFAKVIDSKSL